MDTSLHNLNRSSYFMPAKIYQVRATSYCLLDNVSVFFDRRRDKYHYLNKNKTELLKRLSDAAQDCNSSQTDSTPSLAIDTEELTQKKLLTTKVNDGKAIQPVTRKSPHSSIYDVHWQRRMHPTVIASLVVKYKKIRKQLKGESLYETTRYAEKIKTRIEATNHTLCSEKVLLKSKRIIDSRYYVYTYKDKCLLDSCLFFTHFISLSVPVNWVFGVSLYPFAAHCWVEYNGVVLNDHLERVAAFTPIYVI